MSSYRANVAIKSKRGIFLRGLLQRDLRKIYEVRNTVVSGSAGRTAVTSKQLMDGRASRQATALLISCALSFITADYIK